MLTDDFFSVLGVLPESQRVLERLQSRYDIFIATAAMEVPSSFNPKFHWLARHFPFIPTSHIVFCGDKSILRGDYLIDDNPRQLERFAQTREGDSPREGILFTSPANANVTGFRRVNNWLDVEKMFLGSVNGRPTDRIHAQSHGYFFAISSERSAAPTSPGFRLQPFSRPSMAGCANPANAPSAFALPALPRSSTQNRRQPVERSCRSASPVPARAPRTISRCARRS